MKTCFKCNKEKELSEFYVHHQMADGHLGKCKECAKKDVLEHRKANLERIRAYDRERGKLPHRKVLNEKITKRYRKLYPIRYAAKILVNNAVRDKRLSKPDKCSECDNKDLIYGHHEDYYKPLEVI